MDIDKDTFKDLEELCIDDEEDDLTVEFQSAANRVQTLASSLNNDTLLALYGFYKQAIEGKCNVPRPSWYDFKAKSKWDAWNALDDMPKATAKSKYIELVEELDSDYERKPTKTKSKEGWVTVSTLQKSSDSEEEQNEGIVDLIKTGDHIAVEKCLISDKSGYDINQLDDNGMCLLHWATDRGSTQIIKILLENGANINAIDADGQSAIHYASSCGHLDCIELLLGAGADVFIKDNDGLDAFNAANDDTVKEFLKNCTSKLA